jgi:hypothetical protein
MQFSGNECIIEYDQVAEDKLAVMFSESVCIYSLVDGSLLFSKDVANATKLICCDNKFVFVYSKFGNYREEEHKLLVINLSNGMQCDELSVDDFVLSVAYLENGTLIVGGYEPSTWKADCWPFERIEGRRAFRDEANVFLALPGQCFASTLSETVNIWDYDKKFLNEFKTRWKVSALNVIRDDVILIHDDTGEVLISNYKTGNVLSKIEVPGLRGGCFSSFLTKDNAFLVMFEDSEIIFFHLHGSYVYSRTRIAHSHQFERGHGALKILNDGRFVQKNNHERSLTIFTYNV